MLVNKKARQRRVARRKQRRNKNVNNCIDWNIMLTNMRGFNSKKLSLKEVVKPSVDVLILNETHLRGKKKLKFE